MRIILFLIAFTFVSCNSTKIKTAKEIVSQSIKASGANKVSSSKIEFTFRKGHYKAFRNNGEFVLESDVVRKGNKRVKDMLSNNDFTRHIDNEKIHVPDSMKTRYSGSVNSVHYFSVLPFGLNDKAVHKKLLEDVVIKNKSYYKIQITFSEDGGGEDFEDVFIYWVNKKTNFIDYLAYSYHVNGGGMRFREAHNERFIKGVRFVDYINYKPKKISTKLKDLDDVFQNNMLKKLSEINLEDITVELINL